MLRCILLMVALFPLQLATAKAASEPISTPVPAVDPQQKWTATDTLAIQVDKSEDANQCLKGLAWSPGSFEVVCLESRDSRGDRLIQFPSAITSGDPVNDVVSMEWHFSKDQNGAIQKAPAIVVVHESGSRMEVGRIFASSLCHLGFHTFMIQLPYYGHRRAEGRSREEANQFLSIKQAVSDVRRARDAVAAIPFIDTRTIALQGTSLGGFVSTTAASLDAQYDAVFLMLAGGDLYDILQNGAKDAAKARERLEKHGLVGDQLKAITLAVEPIRVAHRLPSQQVWLYSGLYDQVVPFKNALLLARTMQLQETHHIRMPANHYTGAVFLPMIFAHIRDQLNTIHAEHSSTIAP